MAPWRSIDRDNQGVPTVSVNEDDLRNFPWFMSSILKERVGMDQGVFKIRLDDGTDRPTKLKDLTSFILKYFKTKAYVEPDFENCGAGGWEYPKLQQQQFFFGLHNEHVYGFKSPSVPNKVAGQQRNAFIAKFKNPDLFSTSNACCLSALSESVDALDQHFWSVIRSSSKKSSGMSNSDDYHDVHMLEVAAKVRQKYCFPSDAVEAFTPKTTESQCSGTADDVPSSQSKPKTQMLLYAPGIPLKDQSFPICSNFSLSNLKTVLDEYNLDAGGVSYPSLYVANPHSSFPWHTEDGMLFSINYLHYGAPCVWYFVPPKYYKKFLDLVPFFPLDPKHTSCNGILGGAHKYLMASKDFLKKLGIPVLMVIQQEREIIVTYPFALHSGFKMGWNIQEAVNFADEWWVEPSLLTPICDCFPDTVHIDLAMFIAICRPHLLQMYINNDKIGLLQALSKNAFIVQLGLLPHVQEGNAVKHEELSHDISESNNLILLDEEDSAAAPSQEEERLPYKFHGARCILKCPAEKCMTKYDGGRSKLYRLRNHIRACHSASPDLLKKVELLYPEKVDRKKKTGSSCPVCGEWKVGGCYEMKLHLRRKHKEFDSKSHFKKPMREYSNNATIQSANSRYLSSKNSMPSGRRKKIREISSDSEDEDNPEG